MLHSAPNRGLAYGDIATHRSRSQLVPQSEASFRYGRNGEVKVKSTESDPGRGAKTVQSTSTRTRLPGARADHPQTNSRAVRERRLLASCPCAPTLQLPERGVQFCGPHRMPVLVRHPLVHAALLPIFPSSPPIGSFGCRWFGVGGPFGQPTSTLSP